MALAYFVINLHHWLSRLNVQASYSHVKGTDNDCADMLSREGDISKIIRKGWDPAKQVHIDLAQLIQPPVAALFPMGAEITAPRRQLKAIHDIRRRAEGCP